MGFCLRAKALATSLMFILDFAFAASSAGRARLIAKNFQYTRLLSQPLNYYKTNQNQLSSKSLCHTQPSAGERFKGVMGNESERTLWVMQRRVVSVCSGASVCSAPAANKSDLEQTSGSICIVLFHIIIIPALRNSPSSPKPAEQPLNGFFPQSFMLVYPSNTL